jgi:UPF0755 protein
MTAGRRNTSWWLLGFLALAALILAPFSVFLTWAMAPALPKGKTVVITVRQGDSAAGIAHRLEQEGAIRNARVFTFYARRKGLASRIRPGDYRVRDNDSVQRLLSRLVAGDAEARWVTIPEGKTASQVAEILGEKGFCSEDEFRELTRRKPKHLGVALPVSRASLEGYLMPDTYKLPTDANEKAIAQVMLRNWNAKVLKPNRALISKSGLTPDKAVIIASMIEREARVAKDRTLISSVVRNRLKRKMPLQIDATVIYALGRHKSAVTYADLKTDHPYNTYRNAGLPPGPICNPGAASIMAALKPATTPYLYYVARPDGSHIFTRTYEEHQAAIRRVRALRRGGKA